MSERFVRCVHCGQHHNPLAAVCPLTGKSPGGTPPATPPATPPVRGPLQSQSTGSSLTTTPMARTDLLGKTIGNKYVVRAILGEGGMGTVYEAEHLTIGRSVALKVLHPKQMRKREAIKRFHHEARAAGAIGHPNICEVYDLGTLDDGRPYLVMEKLAGQTLADRVKAEGGLPFDDIADVLTQVLSGLVAAHEKGIVHRDIKPENVFLTERVGCPPVAKLLDFGVSKMLSPPPQAVIGADDDMDLTRTGMVMGTPYYMSPEQARGDRNLDTRVDLYACGVLAYEAATGRRPFVANNYNALLLQIISDNPPAVHTLRADIPPSFERVIQKAMSRQREDRYQSAAEFQRELQKLRRPQSEIMRSKTPPPPPRRVPIEQRETSQIVELPSDLLGTPSSVDIPARVNQETPLVQRAASRSGFDDISTEIRLNDFSLSGDDEDAATTLMRAEDVRELARSARRPSTALPCKGDATPFDANVTEVTKTEKRPNRKPQQGSGNPERSQIASPVDYNADETIRMDPRAPRPSKRR